MSNPNSVLSAAPTWAFLFRAVFLVRGGTCPPGGLLLWRKKSLKELRGSQWTWDTNSQAPPMRVHNFPTVDDALTFIRDNPEPHDPRPLSPTCTSVYCMSSFQDGSVLFRERFTEFMTILEEKTIALEPETLRTERTPVLVVFRRKLLPPPPPPPLPPPVPKREAPAQEPPASQQEKTSTNGAVAVVESKGEKEEVEGGEPPEKKLKKSKKKKAEEADDLEEQKKTKKQQQQQLELEQKKREQEEELEQRKKEQEEQMKKEEQEAVLKSKQQEQQAELKKKQLQQKQKQQKEEQKKKVMAAATGEKKVEAVVEKDRSVVVEELKQAMPLATEREAPKAQKLSTARQKSWVDDEGDLLTFYPPKEDEPATEKGLYPTEIPPNMITVYTDGACPRFTDKSMGIVGGVGCFIAPNDPRNVSEPVFLRDRKMNSFLAEVLAVKRALEIFPKKQPLLIISDSLMVQKALSYWCQSWERRGESEWRRKGNWKELKVVYELWRRKRAVVGEHGLIIEHVNSHSGVFGNEQADVLAKRGAARFSFTNLHKRKPTLPDEYVTKPEDCDYEEDHEVQPFEP